MGQFSIPHGLKSSGTIIYCSPPVAAQEKGHGAQEKELAAYERRSIGKEADISSGIVTTLSNGLANWVFMVVAMMFPLLNKPIRHVAFSVRQQQRKFGILWFLVGYTIIWTVVGILLLFLSLFLSRVGSERIPLVSGLGNASLFLLAAALVWFPNRSIRMMKCGQTMPIAIQEIGRASCRERVSPYV